MIPSFRNKFGEIMMDGRRHVNSLKEKNFLGTQRIFARTYSLKKGSDRMTIIEPRKLPPEVVQ
jgi:hypothetical protein